MVKRVLAMDREEMRVRVESLLRREGARLAFAVRRPAWRRESLAHAIRPDDPVLGPAVPLLHRRDWPGAHRRLMHAFATSPTGFVLDAGKGASRAAAVNDAFPSAAAHATARAERILDGRFDLLGYADLSFSRNGAGIDWQFDPVHNARAPHGYWSTIDYLRPECGDHKVIWELNRHQYWLALGRAYLLTGEHRYRDAFVAHLDSWLAQNPPLDGINWASMLELGFRAISWLWALHVFATPDVTPPGVTPPGVSPWTVDLLLGLDRQLTLVERHLSRYFSPNTHLLGEALALYVAGRTLPGLVRARSWESIGRSVLLHEVVRQINADGGHAERSTHYHRYTLDFYLLALAIARNTHDEAAPAFARAVERLARFARTMADEQGRVPPIGDEDGGALFPICGRPVADLSDSLQIAATLLGTPALAAGAPAEEAIWMTGTSIARSNSAWPSSSLPETGYYVSRSSRGDQLIVDAGRHGFLNGGHAHADALSMTLSVASRPFLIDPGTGCYTIDPAVRDRFRSTELHNTLTLDGRSQSIPDGPFHWQSEAHGRALDWRSGDGFDFFEGSHDGYAPLVHHRTILSRSGCWIVIDRVLGQGTPRADLHWHFAPSWDVAGSDPRSGSDPRVVRAEHEDGAVVWMLSPGGGHVDLFRGEDGGALGWCAPVYGPLVPTTTMRRTVEAQAPFTAITVIVESAVQPEIEMVRVEAIDPSVSIAFRLHAGPMVETVLFAWPDASTAPDSATPTLRRAAGIETDARVLCWREPPGSPGTAVVLVDGTFARRVARASDPADVTVTRLQATGAI